MSFRKIFGNWRNHAWAWYLAATGTLMMVYLFVPPLKGAGPLINALGFSGAIALVLGIRIHKPRARAAASRTNGLRSPAKVAASGSMAWEARKRPSCNALSERTRSLASAS